MKEITAINAINKNYSPVINGVLTQWERREGAVVFRATSGNDILAELADLFEANLPVEGLGPGVCRTCANFVNTYGDLVYHDRKGVAHSALWNPDHVPMQYKNLFISMRDFVLRAYNSPSQRGEQKTSFPAASIDQNVLPYFADERMCGKMKHGGFNHFYLMWGDKDYNPGTERAKHNDNIQFVAWFLADLKRVKRLSALRKYINTNDMLADNNKLIAAVDEMLIVVDKWKELPLNSTVDYAERQIRIVGYSRGNAHLVVSDGTKQLRGGSASVFFDSIENPEDITDAELKQFMYMTDPDRYKKITRDFNERALLLAEAKLTESGLDKTLQRRCVRKDDVLDLLWSPVKETKGKALGLLSGLEAKPTVNQIQNENHRTRDMSWDTFVNKYLPSLKTLWMVPPSSGNYGALMTCSEPEAPEIFLWDGHISSWFYTNGSHPNSWNLRVGVLVPVTGVMRSPEHATSINPMFTPRDLVVLGEGYHNAENSPGLFKDYMDKHKFDYNNLANIISSFNERKPVEKDPEAVVVYAVTSRAPETVFFGELNGVNTRFVIKSWE